MDTTAAAHHWAITNIGGEPGRHHGGVAATHPDAWTQALAAGRAALLAGDLYTLAVVVDDENPAALYSPARDGHGALDPVDVTADLVEIYQNATAGGVADQIIAVP